MKRRTTPTLKISIPDLDIANVRSIDFIFKETHSETAPAIIKKTYPKEVTYDEAEEVFLMPFKEKETLLFTKSFAYMDTRILLNNDKIPPTEIAKVDMMSTLFGDADV